MEEINHIDELEQMRAELSGFKSELRQQKIISDKIMRRAMQKDYARERSTQWTVVILSVIAVPVLVLLAYFTGVFPVWFLVLTAVFLLACVGITFYRTRRFVSDDIMSADVLTVARTLAACKRFDCRSLLYFSIPVLVVWCGAFFRLLYTNGGELARAMIIGGVIGGIVGLVLGLIYLRDSKRRIDRILAQISEMTDAKCGK